MHLVRKIFFSVFAFLEKKRRKLFIGLNFLVKLIPKGRAKFYYCSKRLLN